jgi:hypothetical protein
VLHAYDGGQGPYFRAITAPWVIKPPTSVTKLLIATTGV